MEVSTEARRVKLKNEMDQVRQDMKDLQALEVNLLNTPIFSVYKKHIQNLVASHFDVLKNPKADRENDLILKGTICGLEQSILYIEELPSKLSSLTNKLIELGKELDSL